MLFEFLPITLYLVSENHPPVAMIKDLRVNLAKLSPSLQRGTPTLYQGKQETTQKCLQLIHRLEREYELKFTTLPLEISPQKYRSMESKKSPYLDAPVLDLTTTLEQAEVANQTIQDILLSTSKLLSHLPEPSENKGLNNAIQNL